MEWKSAQKRATSRPTDGQHQRKYEHERPEVRGGEQFLVPGSNPVLKWQLLSRNSHQDCLSNDSNDQINSIFFYGCETWALLPDSKKRVQPFETECMRKLLRISYLEHRTNDRAEQNQAPCGLKGTSFGNCQETEIRMVRACYAPRQFRGTLEGGRRRARQRKCWMDNVKESKSGHLVHDRTSHSSDRKRISAQSFVMYPRSLDDQICQRNELN